jgi:hypothetical protein
MRHRKKEIKIGGGASKWPGIEDKEEKVAQTRAL